MKINVIHHISRMKAGKKNTTTSTEREKEFDKILHPFMIRNINKLGIEGK